MLKRFARAVARHIQPAPPPPHGAPLPAMSAARVLPVLRAVCPNGKAEVLDGFAASMQDCITQAQLTTTARLAAFIGQCAEESASFTTTVEFATGIAYNGRRDLGNTQPGDGPRFKGRGLIQLTGRSNYREAGQALELPLEAQPEMAAQFPAAALIAAWYWKTRHINPWADRWDLLQVTRLINGGENGYGQRRVYCTRALSALSKLVTQ